MNELEAALRQVAIGDIFHASVRNDGPSYVCLALQVREDAIFARRMPTQSVHWFDRATGVEVGNDEVVIDSIAPLPDDIRRIMLGIDRKFREAEYRRAEEPDWEPAEDYFHLTKDQVRAFSFIHDFYPNNPLPPP
jgi:hypothetical protein